MNLDRFRLDMHVDTTRGAGVFVLCSKELCCAALVLPSRNGTSIHATFDQPFRQCDGYTFFCLCVSFTFPLHNHCYDVAS